MLDRQYFEERERLAMVAVLDYRLRVEALELLTAELITPQDLIARREAQALRGEELRTLRWLEGRLAEIRLALVALDEQVVKE